MSGFTDIHAHFIHGLDDGAQTLEMTYKMLDRAYREGVRTLFATPHVVPGVHPFDAELYHHRLEDAQQWCMEQGYEMTLKEGAEILYTPAIRHYIVDGLLPTLDCGDHVLLEFAPDISYGEMAEAIGELNHFGYIPVLAHVERYDCLYRFKNAYKIKKENDVQFQMNCGYLLEGQGYFREKCTQKWLENGLIDFVASDAHDTRKRPSFMKKAYAILRSQFGKDYADHLMKFAWVKNDM